jgi:hypothetical protein
MRICGWKLMPPPLQFLTDLYADRVENGAAAIKKVRETRPDVYLKVVASILPKQLEIERDPFDGLTDDQLAALIAAARNALGIEEEVEGAIPAPIWGAGMAGK